jgi:hypothetical protein
MQIIYTVDSFSAKIEATMLTEAWILNPFVSAVSFAWCNSHFTLRYKRNTDKNFTYSTKRYYFYITNIHTLLSHVHFVIFP